MIFDKDCVEQACNAPSSLGPTHLRNEKSQVAVLTFGQIHALQTNVCHVLLVLNCTSHTGEKPVALLAAAVNSPASIPLATDACPLMREPH